MVSSWVDYMVVKGKVREKVYNARSVKYMLLFRRAKVRRREGGDVRCSVLKKNLLRE